MSNILKYENNGVSPFDFWIKNADKSISAKVLAAVETLRTGTCSDINDAGDGILTLSLPSGKTLYFTKKDNDVVILYASDNEKVTTADIEKAKSYTTDTVSTYLLIEYVKDDKELQKLYLNELLLRYADKENLNEFLSAVKPLVDLHGSLEGFAKNLLK